MKIHCGQTKKPAQRLALAGIIAAICIASLTAGLLAQAPTPQPGPEVLPDGVEKFIVPTKSKENPAVPFYVRIPARYRKQPENKLYRVLFTCPVYNGDGLKNLAGASGFAALADQRDWFIISPTFHQASAETKDRSASYYYPETFSGQAVLDALELIRKKYPIATGGLLLHGFSGGAQFVHRFAIWAPAQVAAVVVNSSSWFDDPDAKCQQIAWLVTIGESDPSYENTLEFVQKLRDAGALPVLRSYLAMTHERGAKVPDLDVEFLKFYDDLTRDRMEIYKPSLRLQTPRPLVAPAQMPFVGDTQRWRFYPNTPEVAGHIPDEERIYLPSETLAKVWGTPEEGEK